MIIVWEHQASIVEDHIVATFECSHVLADGVKAAQGNDTKLGLRIALARVIVLATLFPAMGVLGMMLLALHRVLFLARRTWKA